MNIVIPMAGRGSRFTEQGYSVPKPFIDVLGKPMVQWAVESIGLPGNLIFIVLQEHIREFKVDLKLKEIFPGCQVIPIADVTEGAACTLLAAAPIIDSDEPLFITNSDQYIEWHGVLPEGDGAIALFKARESKWSFAKVENDKITEVAEKDPISDDATAGFYYWSKGSDFVKYAEQMIAFDKRVNNEFYTCPVYNEAIFDGKIIKPFYVDLMMGMGTPEDLKVFVNDPYINQH